METIRLKLPFAVLAVFAAAAVSRPALAGPSKASQITLTVTDESGKPAPTSAQVQILDSTGKSGTCPIKKPGSASCSTAGLTAPFLLVNMAQTWASPVFGEAWAPTGHFNVDPVTNAGLDQIAHAWGTSVNAWWTPGTAPKLPSVIDLNSNNALLDRAFLPVWSDFKIKAPLGIDVYNFNYKFTAPYGKFEQGLSISGVGSAAQNIQTSLSGSRPYSADFKALPTTWGTVGHWSVTSELGTTVQSGYAMYPSDPHAPAVVQGIQNFYVDLLGVLHHEKTLLDAPNIGGFFSSNYLNNGIDSFLQSEIDATKWRPLIFKSLLLGSIASFAPNTPSTGDYLVGINVLRTVLDHGIPCTSLCCTSLVCVPGSSGFDCLYYGNQRVAGFKLSSTFKQQISGAGSMLDNFLSSRGRAPSGTIQGYVLSDSQHLFYNNTTIPFDKTISETLQDFHKGPTHTVDFDLFRRRDVYQPAAPNGLTFDIEVNPTSGTPQSWTIYPPPYTTEPIQLKGASTNFGDYQKKTQKLTLGIPTTFVLNNQSMRAQECNATRTQDLKTTPSRLSLNSKNVSISKVDSWATGIVITVRQSPLDGPATETRISAGTTCPN